MSLQNTGINFNTSFDKVSNKQYMAGVYGNYTPQMQTADNFVSARQKKKKKIFALSLIGSIFVSLFGIGAAVISHRSPKKLTEMAQTGFKKLKESKFTDEVSNFMTNIINVKDDIYDKFLAKTKKTPLRFLNSIADGITGIYKRTLAAAMHSKYDKAVKGLKKAGYDSEKLKKIEEFSVWYNSTNNKMYNIFQKKGNRVTDDFFNKKIMKKMTSSIIADDKIADLLDKEFIKVPKDASCELESAIKKYNSVKATLLPKMRDINCGSAPTDLLTIATAAGTLGVAEITADTNEDRKSILINTGIPLGVTLASTTYGTMRALTGMKSLLFGLITGQIASFGAKFIDKKISDKKNS